MHTTKLIIHQITQQTRRQSHPGQAKSSPRKHANRAAKRLELTTTAKTKGITVTELVRQRAVQKDNAYLSMVAIEAGRQRALTAMQSAPRRSWMDDFHDDDRRWKY